MDYIRELINKHTKAITAHVGIGFKNLKTNEEFYINGDDTFPSASIFKVPVIIELFNQNLNKKIDLNSKYKYSKEEVSLGSGVLVELSQTIELSYRDYAMLMMLISDNTAADILVNKLGKDNIKLMIENMDLKNTRVDLTCNELLNSCYGVTKLDSYDEIQDKIKEKKIKKDCTILIDCDVENDVTSPKDMIKIFSMLYNKQILNDAACDDILNIMKSCQTNSRIPRYIPKKIAIAHKTGTLDAIANDAGIVYTDNLDYILAVFYNGNMDTDEEYDKNVKGTSGDQFIANLSKEIYEYISSKK